MTVLLPIHIAAGGLAIVLGALALIARKGATVHRTVGIFFVYAMLTMGISGSLMALRPGLEGNVLGGVMCTYFVLTALTAVRARTAASRRIEVGALVLGVTLGTIELALGGIALTRPHMQFQRVPAFMLFFLCTITFTAVAGDIRWMRMNGVRGAARLKRHLWRMCFALFIATASFFSIRARVARVLPGPFLSGPMRALPVVLVFVVMFFWLWRLRKRTALSFS